MLSCGNCEPLKRDHSEIGTHGGVPCNDTEVVLLSLRNILLTAAVVVLCTGAVAAQVKAATAPGPSARQTAPVRYRVQRGDSFFSISRKFNISVQQLQQANNMRGTSQLRAGVTLVIPAPARQSSNGTAQASTTRTATSPAPGFIWPLKTIRSVSKDTRNGARPLGILINATASSTVICSADGTVKKVGYMRGYGTYVIVEHSAHYHTVYANLGRVSVREGQRVNCGSTIGIVEGSTLHFQINQGHTSRDALALLPRR